MSHQELAEGIAKVREALDRGKCLSVDFYKDGSGASFHIIDPHGDHGLPCDISMSFRIDEALQCLSGFRFAQHKHNICF